MKVELNIDPDCREPRVVVYADRMTPEVEALLRSLAAPPPDAVAAQTERGVALLAVEEIIRVYSEGPRVYAQTPAGAFALKARLYEMERRLEGRGFVRISASELVNARMIEGMDFSLTGTIRLSLRGGIQTYVSRRRVAEIKKLFVVR